MAGNTVDIKIIAQGAAAAAAELRKVQGEINKLGKEGKDTTSSLGGMREGFSAISRYASGFLGIGIATGIASIARACIEGSSRMENFAVQFEVLHPGARAQRGKCLARYATMRRERHLKCRGLQVQRKHSYNLA